MPMHVNHRKAVGGKGGAVKVTGTKTIKYAKPMGKGRKI